MKPSSFFMAVTILALALCACLGLLAAYGKKTPETSWWLAVVFLWGITLFTYSMNMRFARDPKNHIRFTMLNNLFRMLLSIAFVALITWKKGKADYVFVSVFFISYFLFTFFEIVAIIPKLRRDLQETSKTEDGRNKKGFRT